jgi:hypothetical protein
MNEPASAYDVNAAWRAQAATDVDGCFRLLLGQPNGVFHGAHEPWETIKSSLDLKLQDSGHRGDKLKCESDLLDRFARQGFRHLVPEARRHIELARLRWSTFRTTATIFVGRHFGLPTRGVDWTPNALVALFFASRRAPQKDGVIWCMDLEEFEKRVANQWPQAYGKKGNIESDFERDLTDGVDKDVLVPLHFPGWMPRAVAQGAFLTAAGQLDMDHAQKIFELGVTACGRVIVPAAIKSAVIEKLDLMGVNGHTLQIGDSTVETIASDVSASMVDESHADNKDP